MYNFASFADRIELAAQGVFSVDQPAHRVLRAQQKARAEQLDSAYADEGLNRADEYRRIAAELEVGRTDGIWARSTKEYAVKCRELDDLMLDAAGETADDL